MSFLGEVVRLCSVWDTVDIEKNSIPTIIFLIDDPGVRRTLFHNYKTHAKGQHRQTLREDPTLLEFSRQIYQRELEFDRKRFERNWQSGVNVDKQVEQSPRLSAVRAYRDNLVQLPIREPQVG